MEISARRKPEPELGTCEIIRGALNNLAYFNLFLPNLTEEGQRLLAEAGIVGAEQCAEFQQILNLAAIGAAQQNPCTQAVQEFTLQQQVETARQQLELTKTQLKQQVELVSGDKERFNETMRVIKAMKDGLRKTIEQIDRAFTYTMWMYILSFVMGLALMVAAIWSAFYGKSLLTLVLGGFGTANTLTFFFTRPPERLQSSRASLAQLQIALLAWFTDFFNQNALMVQENSYQVKAGKLDKAPFAEISETIIDHTEKMMIMLQKYCKLVENPVEQEDSEPLAVATKSTPSAEAETAPRKE